MATRVLKSIKGRRMRITRLSAIGDPLNGVCGSLVTDGFIRVGIGQELEAGEEYQQKNAYGELCINDKDGDVIKYVPTTMQFCMVHPDVLDIVVGANPVFLPGTSQATVSNKALTSNIATITTSAAHGFIPGQSVTIALSPGDAVFDGVQTIATVPTATTFTFAKTNANVASTAAAGTATVSSPDTIGATFSPNPNPDRFALEIWTKNVNTTDPSPTRWGYFVVPNIANGLLDGEVVVENGVLTISAKGDGFAATADWGVNPYNDNPLLQTSGFPTGDQWGYALTTVQPPAVTNGCVPLI